MANEPRFEVYPRMDAAPDDPDQPFGPQHSVPSGDYGWRFRAANGRISAVGGEGFTRREDAHRAVSDFLFDCGAPDPSPPTVDVDE